MKTVLITGASSGIGYATALIFAKHQYQVIATMRDLSKQDALQTAAIQAGVTIDIRQLDVTDDHSVTTLVENILRDYGQLDVLINNAGAGLLATLEQTSLTQAKNMMEVNFFGVWRMTQAVLPSMRKRKSGHIITVTSIGGVVAQPFNEAYCAAKFAVEGMMESLSLSVKDLGVQITLVEPGPVYSEFVSSTTGNSPQLATELEQDYRATLNAYFQMAREFFQQHGQKPDEIAQVLLNIATHPTDQLRYQTSAFSENLIKNKLASVIL